MPTDEEILYKALVEDICAREIPQYQNLGVFVEKLLKKKVEGWCYNTYVLRGGLHHDDVLQEIQIRIMKKCEQYFFKPCCGKTEKSCEEFKAWCTVVAKNYFLNYCVKPQKRKEVEINLSCFGDDEPGSSSAAGSIEFDENAIENRKNINKCFSIVMDLKSSPHIILTWLSVSLVMLECDVNKINSTHLIVKKFSEVTLFEMFDVVIKLIAKYDWIVFTDEQIALQREKLQTINKDTGVLFGNMKYKDFYMKKGPEMSISDWVNRVNSQIKKFS